MDRLQYLSEITPSDYPLLGERAVYLSDLFHHGYAITSGLVIPATWYWQFLEGIDWLEPLLADLPNSSLHVNINNPQQLQAIARRLRQTILTTPLPEDWAIALHQAIQRWQPNPVVLYPGLVYQAAPGCAIALDRVSGRQLSNLLDSHLCETQGDRIAHAVKRCWAEPFHARNLLCWQRFGIQLQQLSIAVLVQPLPMAICSGTLRLNTHQSTLEAVWGLDLALKRGELSPDLYHLQLDQGVLLDQRINRKTIAYLPQIHPQPSPQLQPQSSSASPEGDSRVSGQHRPETTAPLAPSDRSSFSTQHSTLNTIDAPIIPALFAASQPYPPLSLHSCIQAYLIDEVRQQEATLTPTQLQDFIQLAQRLQHSWGKPLTVEWVLHQAHPQQPPTITITTAYPYLLLDDLGHAAGLAVPQPRGLMPLSGSSANATPPLIPQLERSTALPERSPQPDPPSHPSVPPSPIAPAIAANLLPDPSFGQPPGVTAAKLPSPIAMGIGVTAGRAIAEAHVITNPLPDNLADIPAGKILVTSQIAPCWLPWLQQCAGMIAERGGLTSHCAILARELGIPAIVGVPNVTRLVKTGELLLLDGAQGLIYRSRLPPGEVPWPQFSPPHEAAPPPPPVTSLPPISTQLMLNLSQLSTLPQAAQLPVEGVGLLRSELMLLDVLQNHHPLHWVQTGQQRQLSDRIAAYLEQFALAFAPRPVFYRSLDLRSHEFQSLHDSPPLGVEVNPILGVRGTLGYCQDPALFDVELAALAQVQHAGLDNLHLILPFVRTVEEFQFCRQHIQQSGIDLTRMQCWIMAEVPSVLFLLPEYVAAGVQGIAIGTNDLTQLLLGIDRDHPQLATVFNERHLAVKRAMAHLIQSARTLGIPCSICGQAPVHYPDLVDDLVRWGITTISVELSAVEQTYRAIARAEHSLVLNAARQQLQSQADESALS